VGGIGHGEGKVVGMSWGESGQLNGDGEPCWILGRSGGESERGYTIWGPRMRQLLVRGRLNSCADVTRERANI